MIKWETLSKTAISALEIDQRHATDGEAFIPENLQNLGENGGNLWHIGLELLPYPLSYVEQ